MKLLRGKAGQKEVREQRLSNIPPAASHPPSPGHSPVACIGHLAGQGVLFQPRVLWFWILAQEGLRG